MIVAGLPGRAGAHGPAPAARAAPGVEAAPGGGEVKALPAESSASSDVNRMFTEGKVRFDQQDYDGALAIWGEAYTLAPATLAGRSFRVGLAPHLALAHEYRYRLRGNREDLRRTKSLLEWHIAHYKALYKPTVKARDHITSMTQWAAQVDRELARTKAGPVAAVAPPPPRPPPRPPSKKKQAVAALRADPELYGRYRSGRGMLVGGSIMAGAGGIVSLVALTFVNTGAADPATLFTGLSGAGLIGGGVALIVVGSRRKSGAMREARGRVALVPTGPGFALVGRF